MAQRTDEQIREAIHERLVKLPFTGPTPSLEVDVADGIVTLKGDVPAESDRKKITSAVQELKLATDVRDELRVKS